MDQKYETKLVLHLGTSTSRARNVYYVAYPRSAQAYGDAKDSNLGEREKVFKCACQLSYVIFTTECITGLLVYLFIFLRKS